MSTKVKLDRRNTGFPLQLFEHFKKDLSTGVDPEYAFLKYYQEVVRRYVRDVDIDARGLLIHHEMGLGKSILAIALAVDLIKEMPCIMLLTKSLQENMVRSIHKYVKMRATHDPNWPIGRFSTAELDQWIKHNFSFVSMNAGNMMRQMGKASEGQADDFMMEEKFGEIARMGSLDGKLLIVDEAHNLFRAVTNGSKNAIGLYDLVMKSKCKVFFLTGTPIANDPFELVPCFNMLGSKRPGVLTFPEEYKEFYKLYVDSGPTAGIKNREKFQNRIMGLVSKVDHHSTPGKGVPVAGANNPADTEIKVEFPELKEIKVERVPMDENQWMKYKLARDREQQEGSRKGPGGAQFKERFVQHPPLVKPKSDMASSYRVRSRQLGNFCPPGTIEEIEKITIKDIPKDQLESAKFRRINKNISERPKQLGLVYSQFTGMGGLGTFAAYLKSLGWAQFDADVTGGDTAEWNGDTAEWNGDTAEWNGDAEMVGGDDTNRDGGARSHGRSRGGYGPAIPTVDDYIKNIHKEAEKIENAWWVGGDDAASPKVAYDDKTGVTSDEEEFDIAKMVEDATFEKDVAHETDISSLPKSSTGNIFAIISGEVDVEQRARIERVFRSPENMHGEIISLLLISSTGAEGLDLKCVRHIHIMEPYWNWGRLAQIISRGVRNDSHIDLPPDEKNVTAFIYLAVPPESAHETAETTDVELYEDSIKNQVGIASFVDAVDETSIECPVNMGKNCRMCSPTDRELFTDDASRDIRTIDPCQQLQETHMRAEEIVIDGVKYFYSANPKSIWEYSVFTYEKSVDGYRPLKESDKRFPKIIEAIKEGPKNPILPSPSPTLTSNAQSDESQSPE